MKNLTRRAFGNTTLYRFFSWLYGKYLEDQRKMYRPEDFRYFGKGAMVRNNVAINYPERVILKERATIQDGTIINSAGGLYVGENTGIGYNCIIFTAQHRYHNADAIPFDNVAELKPVIIREYVWIGASVMILPGIEIGEGAILGMGAVITKNVPPLAIVLGNPAKVIGYRSEDHYYSCKSKRKHQTICIEKNIRRIPPVFRKRYEKELEELGIIELIENDPTSIK
jgi:acetyltransferase-like isoleucine patch superfamily enzyme